MKITQNHPLKKHTIRYKHMENNNLITYDYYFDMDGVLNTFEFGTPEESLYIPGYFENRPSQPNIINAVNYMLDMELNERFPIRVHILSMYLKRNKTAVTEKNKWLDQYIPRITPERRIFLSTEENKTDYIKVSARSVLIDDYGENLKQFKRMGGRIVKVSTDAIDRRKESKEWPACISPEQSTIQIVDNIMAFQRYEMLYHENIV